MRDVGGVYERSTTLLLGCCVSTCFQRVAGTKLGTRINKQLFCAHDEWRVCQKACTCVYACAPVCTQLCSGSDLRRAEKILLQVFIIASVLHSGSVCVRVEVVLVMVEVCIGGGSTLLCFPPASPSQPLSHCTLGNRESHWGWLVPAESQIEFWQAGETRSQRDPPPPPQWAKQGSVF